MNQSCSLERNAVKVDQSSDFKTRAILTHMSKVSTRLGNDGCCGHKEFEQTAGRPLSVEGTANINLEIRGRLNIKL